MKIMILTRLKHLSTKLQLVHFFQTWFIILSPFTALKQPCLELRTISKNTDISTDLFIFLKLNSCEQQHLSFNSHLSYFGYFSPDPKGLSSSPEPVSFTRFLSYNVQTVLAHSLVNFEHQRHRSKSHTITNKSSNQSRFHSSASKHHVVRHLAFFMNLTYNGSDFWFLTWR